MTVKKKIYYIIEPERWVIREEGFCVQKYMKKNFDVPIEILPLSERQIKKIKNSVIHFGSKNLYMPEIYKIVDESNHIILTWYHGTDNDLKYINLIPDIMPKVDIIHSSCSISKDNLIRWGVEENKIVVIPIGIDSRNFNIVSSTEKLNLKKKVGIPPDVICIGSFQKDGEGWGEGMNPKLIKGPDIFCDVIIQLSKRLPIFVLLTGPARGYVKKRLSENNILFKHFYLKNYSEIPKYFKCIDYYLITSRAEGGPKAMMESFASGIPLISSDVGMVHDYCIDEQNAMVCPIENTDCLVKKIIKLHEDPDLRQKLIKNGLETVKKLDWGVIIKSYYEKIYSRYL